MNLVARMRALFGKPPPLPPPPALPPLPDVTLNGPVTASDAAAEKSYRVSRRAHEQAKREHVKRLRLPFEDLERIMQLPWHER